MRKEKMWKSKYKYLYEQVTELISIIKIHKRDLKTNPNAKPVIFTKNVGTQTTIISNTVN